MSHASQPSQPRRAQGLPYSSLHRRAGVSRRLAPEDVTPGQYVCVLMRHERIWRFDPVGCTLESHRVRDMPEQDEEADSQVGGRAGAPLRVLAVSLPFVVVRAVGIPRAAEASDAASARRACTLDLRQVELAEVGRAYARAFAHAARPARPRTQANVTLASAEPTA